MPSTRVTVPDSQLKKTFRFWGVFFSKIVYFFVTDSRISPCIHMADTVYFKHKATLQSVYKIQQ